MSDVEEEKPASRIGQWFSTGAFGCIALVAITSEMDGDASDQDRELKWAISALSIVIAFSGLAFFAHIAKDRFVGTHVEGGLSLMNFAMMAAVLPAIMDPDNRIAVARSGAILNANLYFFSWGAFIAAMMVFSAYARDVHKVGLRSGVDFHTMNWFGIMASSFVVMVSSARLFDSLNCDNDNIIGIFGDQCDRTKFAIAIGTITALFSIIWLFLGARLPGIFDGFFAICLLIMWCFGVAYITFSDKAPAQFLGNFYFSTWITFILACRLAANGLMKVFNTVTNRGKGDDDKNEGDKPADEEAGGEGGEATGDAGGDDE